MDKQRIDVQIEQNKVIDDGHGVITFKGGLTLSDESEQRNGTRYDIASMDLSKYDGTVFADHDYSVSSIVGKAIGVAKKAKRLVAEGVEFAVKESALARYVHDMVLGGFINAVSIGSLGELDENGVYKNAQILEFSFVGIGNNMNAKIKNLAKNTLEKSEADGLDTKELQNFLANNHISVEEDESQEKETQETTIEENTMEKTIETKAEEIVENKAETVEEPKADTSVLDAVNKMADSVKGLSEKVETMEKNAFDKGATEPEFKPSGSDKAILSAHNQFASMDWHDLTALQVQSFWKSAKQGDSDAAKQLMEINKFNKEQLVKQNMAKNAIGMGDFGNFVTSPELLTEIQGYRTDFAAILSAFPYRQTNSLDMAWLTRNGDIDMQTVEMCDDDANGNLKPVSTYGATATTKSLEELAAVTPVCTAATIFLAADLLGDAAAGYRNSYDRNKARGIIAALEKAAEDNDTASIAETGDLTNAAGANAWLGDIRQAIFAISQGDGNLIMNEASFGMIWNALLLTGNGNVLSQQGLNGTTSTLWTKRIVVVPNELMPTLGDTGTYRTFDYEGSTVTINHAIFYVNPSNVSARENGGLRYDLSTEAAYEINGTVYSAYQRNEIVLRGSHFRGTVVLDPTRVGAVRAGAVIS
jgi:hypothetical protein